MSNPVTRKLIERIDDRRLAQFVARWDALEALVIRVYRSKTATPQDEREYRQLRRWLHRKYGRYREALTPYWQAATINAEPVSDDPYLALIGYGSAADFVDNWPAMRTLPAARQALNEWLVDQTGTD